MKTFVHINLVIIAVLCIILLRHQCPVCPVQQDPTEIGHNAFLLGAYTSQLYFDTTAHHPSAEWLAEANEAARNGTYKTFIDKLVQEPPRTDDDRPLNGEKL